MRSLVCATIPPNSPNDATRNSDWASSVLCCRPVLANSGPRPCQYCVLPVDPSACDYHVLPSCPILALCTRITTKDGKHRRTTGDYSSHIYSYRPRRQSTTHVFSFPHLQYLIATGYIEHELGMFVFFVWQMVMQPRHTSGLNLAGFHTSAWRVSKETWQLGTSAEVRGDLSCYKAIRSSLLSCNMLIPVA